jgi:type VI secretion system ImpA family protein
MDSLANRDFTFDISKLLVPITQANPSGESLRYDAVYDQIREARRQDDADSDRGVWTIDIKKSDWSIVANLCIDALEKRTKDLQIAAWLLEAWLRQYGLPGLREGFRLLNDLCVTFWDTIHPIPEDGDLEYRVAPFEWANEKVSVVLKLVPVTNPSSEKLRPYSLADWEIACRPTAQDEETGAVEEKITQESFQEVVSLTPTADLATLLGLIDGASAALNKLNATLDDRCGNHSPGLGRLSSALSGMRGLVQTALSQRPSEAPKTSSPATSGGQSSPDENTQVYQESGEAASSGPIRSRAEAYRRLAEASDFLVKTEPHSPVPYLVKRAIAWGSMNLEDLLPQLVRNNSELSEIYRLLQIGRPEE